MSADGHRVAIVTGAAQGLGEAIAKRFLAERYKVVFGDVNTELVQQTARAWSPEEAQPRRTPDGSLPISGSARC